MAAISQSPKIICGRSIWIGPRISRIACGSAVLVLAITLAAKTYEIIRWEPYMSVKDPVLPMATGLALSLAAVCEATVGILLLTGISARLKSVALGWLCALFITYRTVLHLNQPGALCSCLGRFLGKMGVSTSTVEILGLASLVVLVICAVLIWISPVADPNRR